MATNKNDGNTIKYYPIRLLDISGFEQRKNHVIYCPPFSLGSMTPELVVFFPGDIQDFSESMQSHRDNKFHNEWSLDNVTYHLGLKFPNCHIIVVKPSRMIFKTFSCFDNFVECANSKDSSAPEHSPNFHSLLHLELLIENVSNRLKTLDENQLEELIRVSKGALSISGAEMKFSTKLNQYNINNLSACAVNLIGFSKGCVVLNQFVHEFHTSISSNKIEKYNLNIISRIKNMYWLDGGHSGGKNTWVTNKEILNSFKDLGINVHVHVSPYQIQDQRRPWIREEEKRFSDTLSKLGCNIERICHFEDETPSITAHFNVLKVFK